jgi:hypothetical protein
MVQGKTQCFQPAKNGGECWTLHGCCTEGPMAERSEWQETHETPRRFLLLQHALEYPALETAVRAERKAWRDRQTNRLARFKTRPLAATPLLENERALLSEALAVEIAANDPEPLKQTVLLNKFRTGDLPFFYLDALKNAVPGSKSDWQQTTMAAVLDAIRNDKSQAVLIDARQLAQACKQITEPAGHPRLPVHERLALDLLRIPPLGDTRKRIYWKDADRKLREHGIKTNRTAFFDARRHIRERLAAQP